MLTGGTEIQTLSLVRALVGAGHEVVTVCYFEHSAEMVARYRQAGCRVVLLSETGHRPAGVKATFSALWKGLRRVVREFRPDVAHVQYMAPGALPIVILRLLGVRRVIATAHTSADIYPSLRDVRFVARRLTTAFQCITLRAEESFFGRSQLFSPEMTLRKRGNHFTIYNALPPYISVAEEARNFDGPLTVGVVSRLEEIKGMDLVVPAFARVLASRPEARLVVVGDGSLRGAMEAQAREAGVDDRVTFAGRQPQEGLQGWYDGIDVLLMPSRSEGFGLTAIEGMARGCVVVAAETGGLPEVVTEDCGRLHRVGDADDLAARILEVAGDLDGMRTLCRNALARARTYDSGSYGKQVALLYSMMEP